ncbi:MFS transporter [Vogesella oryzae]|uniref:MFS transporter n=1 Tax=Vogesella oryzae TaxID=1735285 RepID=UPI0015834873|nr:MFS transporter [Vogesella oryzae]
MSAPKLFAPPYTRHHLAIALIVLLEYLQSVMVAFGSHAVSQGVGATPQQFSLAAAGYAAVAVLMILCHRWLVQRLGYRSMLRWSLLAFGAGALLSALAASPAAFIAARMVQALGGAAFFTASRVQIMHYRGPQRLQAMLFLPVGIMLGSGLAPILAALLLALAGWQALFLIMLPLVWLADLVVRSAVPEHEPVENERPDRLHPRGIALLAGGVFLLQFVLERARFELWTRGASLWALGGVACVLLLLYLRHEWRRRVPLVPYRHFASERYLWGMAVYGIGYLVVSGSAYVLPLYMAQGLGMDQLHSGIWLSVTGLLALPFAIFHLMLMVRWPHVRRYLSAGALMLAAAALLLAQVGPDSPPWLLVAGLLLLHSLFMPFFLGTTAAATFSLVDEKVFSHAYQVKNAMREIANAVGLSWGVIIMQQRSMTHAAELPASAPAQLVLQSGQDYFWLLALLALVLATFLRLQRRFV